MHDTQAACEHDAAIQERPGLFFCPLCGDWFDLDGNTVADPTDAPKEDGGPKAPKAEARANQKRAKYRRDESLKVTVKCRHPQCNHKWKVWPQNADQPQDCPQLHRPLKKLAQARERQTRWRQKQ